MGSESPEVKGASWPFSKPLFWMLCQGVLVVGLGVQKGTETVELTVFVAVVVIVAEGRVMRSVARDVTLGL